MSSISIAKHHLHFIGVGGIGMSALALILAKRGFSVSGSDKNTNNTLQDLAKNGVKIFQAQKAENINELSSFEKLPIVICSSAITKENSELKAATKKNLTILHRSDILAYLIDQQSSVVIAGSHGKTTTSTIVTTLLKLCDKDPTSVVGGYMPIYNSNCHSGSGEFLIAEGDESDGTLVKFKAKLGVLTNIELDHTDHYRDINSLINTMKIFGQNCHSLIINFDCPNLKNNFKSNTISWSITTHNNINFAAIPKETNSSMTIADYFEEGRELGEIKIPLLGSHNLSNTLGAIAVCRTIGVELDDIKKNLKHIKLPERRFQFRGIWRNRQIVDDYAHHPSELKATIKMARLILNKKNTLLPKNSKRLILVFQPHRYSRTKDLMKDFASSLSQGDMVFLAPIYSAGEEAIAGISSELMASKIKEINSNIPTYTSTDIDHLQSLLFTETKEHDLILILGAGNINQLWENLLQNHSLTNIKS